MRVALVSLAMGLVMMSIAAPRLQADSVSPGEQFALAGILSTPSSVFDFSLSFTIGSLVKTTDWTIVNTTLAPGLHCGTLDCSTLSWTYSLQFDASNDTLFGTATAPFVANDSRLLTFTYEDGNISSNPFENADLTIPSNNRSGTFSYSVAPVPEPSSALLLGFCLLVLVPLLAGLARKTISRRAVPVGTA